MKFVVVIGLAVGLSACSIQPKVDSPMKTASGESCRVNAVAVCQSIADKPVVMTDSGLTMDSRNASLETARTNSLNVPIQVPNGSMLEFHCEINTRHQSVIYAGLDEGPALTDHDVEYLRSAGLCTL